MTTITISDLATAPQINSRRIAHDLIEWLAHRGWVIVQGQIELPMPIVPWPPVPQDTRPTSYGDDLNAPRQHYEFI